MQFRNLGFVAGLFLLVGSSALANDGDTAAAGAPVTLKLYRPSHVGDINEYSGHYLSSQEMTLNQGGKVVQHNTEVREVSCVIRERVLKVSDGGQILQRRAELKTFQVRNAEGAPLKDMSLAGVTVEATLEPAAKDATIKRTDGKPLSDDEQAYLGMVFSGSHRKSNENDDTIFGPPGPVKVGDKWKANHALISSGLSEASGMILPVTSLTSEFTLASQEANGGVNYLTVNGTVHADSISMPLPSTVKGTPLSGTMQMSFAKTLPADPTKKERDSNLDFQVSVKGTLEDPGGPVDMTMVVKQHQDMKTLSTGK